MKAGMFLAIAIVGEVVATSALKSTDGFTRLGPSVVVMAGYAMAFYCLSLALKTMPVGVAYALWSDVGTVLIAIFAWLFQAQKLDVWGVVGIALIVSGVGILNVLSRASVH